MAHTMNERQCTWTPRISLGPFVFGERLDADKIGLTLEAVHEPYEPDPRRQRFEVPSIGMRVVLDHGVVAFVRAWERITYESQNLIGLPPAAAAALIGGVWDGPIDCRDGSFRHICDAEGIILWSRGGAAEFASVRKPYAWDWVPNERVGEIRFGAPLPEGPSLAFREDPARSNDEETCYDVVTHGVDVRVDPKTRMVTEIGTRDSLRYRGKELIGRTFAEVKAVVGGDWDVVGIGEPDIQIEESLGISVHLDDDDPDVVLAIRLDADAVLAKDGD